MEETKSYGTRDPVKSSESGGGFWKFLTLMSFIMLSGLTWGQRPLQRAIDAVSHKKELEARKIACDELVASIDVNKNHVRKSFIAGCMWDYKTYMLYVRAHGDEKQMKMVEEMFEKQDSPEFQKLENFCSEPAAEYVLKSGDAQTIVGSIAERLKCKEVYKELISNAEHTDGGDQ